HRVDDGNRLRLPVESAKHVPWLDSEDRQVLMVPGIVGGVQLLRVPIAIDGFEAVISALEENGVKDSESATDFARLVRYSVTQIDVEFTKEKSRYAVILPREFRDLGILPNTDESAVFF